VNDTPVKKKYASSRGVAAGIIAAWLERGEFPDRALEAVTADRAFVQELVFGVVRQRRTLVWFYHKLAEREPAAPLFALALVGLYQLLWLDDVAPFAAVHETSRPPRPSPARAPPTSSTPSCAARSARPRRSPTS